jgi:hypothetical protein
MNARSNAATRAFQRISNSHARFYEADENDVCGYRDLCDEGILIQRPYIGDRARFELTPYGVLTVTHDQVGTSLNRLGGPTSNDIVAALSYIMARLGPPQLGSGEP